MNGQRTIWMNISIIVTLIMFIGFFIDPLKHMFYTNHDQNENNFFSDNNNNNNNNEIESKRQRLYTCPSGYKHWMEATFSSNHDKNCTYLSAKGIINIDSVFENTAVATNNTEKEHSSNYSIVNGIKIIKPKSVQVTDCILALLLIVSIIAAFIELFRNRFMNLQDASLKIGRRSVIMDSIQSKRCSLRDPIKNQMSGVGRGLQHPPLRIIGTRTPTLVRGSSFPIYFSLDLDVNDSTPPHSPRRMSVNIDNDASTNILSNLPRRTHLIRRY